MGQNEVDAIRMAEQLQRLPEGVQERVGYIIQGAILVAGNYALTSTPPLARSSSGQASQPST